MKLIIVEGIPGSGKSTTARLIALQSERNGHATKLFHESAYRHPILIHETIHTPNHWMETYFSNWDKFLKEYEDDDVTVVMEAVLLQAPILRLLHSDLPKEVILRFIENLFSRLSENHCRLVFLYQEDPSAGIDRMMNARGGKEWLTSTFEKYKHEPYYANHSRRKPESHLDFLHEYAEIARSAFVRCDLRSLAIDNTAWDWTSYHAKILESFGWSYVPDPIVSEAELAKYVGVYRNEELGVTARVQVGEGQLTVFGNQRVRVKEPHVFYMENVSILIRFIIDPNGECNQFIVEEKDVIGNRKEEGTRFRRIS